MAQPLPRRWCNRSFIPLRSESLAQPFLYPFAIGVVGATITKVLVQPFLCPFAIGVVGATITISAWFVQPFLYPFAIGIVGHGTTVSVQPLRPLGRFPAPIIELRLRHKPFRPLLMLLTS
jgi:hypothetical protein